MANTGKDLMIPDELVMNKIYLIRGQKVMLDRNLAELYSVETRQLKRQVKRNLDRFPADFMFELSEEELNNLRSQIGTSSWGSTRYTPYAFTEQGVAMLSSVLKSETAIRVNIQIIRIFTRMREMIMTHKDILLQLEKMKKKLAGFVLRSLGVVRARWRHYPHLWLSQKIAAPPQTPRRKIGFKREDERD